MDAAKRVLLGRIVAAHGIRGEVLIKSFTADPTALAGYGPLADAAGTRTFDVAIVRSTGKGIVARIAGVGDRTAAEQLAGTEIYVERSRLPPPEPGEFYHADLIGLAAVAPDGREIGTVVAVQNFGAGDLIEVRLAGSRRTELLPFQDAFVPNVDLAAGRVTVLIPAEPRDED